EATEQQVEVALEVRPPITAEVRVGGQRRPGSASANVSVEQPSITAEARIGGQTRPASASATVPLITAGARVGNQTPPASASANLSVTLEEQPGISADAFVGGQTLLVSANANVSAEPATNDNVAESGSAPDVTPSSFAETVEQGTEGWDKSDADTT